MQELYFCLTLTAEEHDIVEYYFRKECERLKCEMVYYRRLKDGHVATYREVKIRGSRYQINHFKDYLRTHEYIPSLVKNPHKVIHDGNC